MDMGFDTTGLLTHHPVVLALTVWMYVNWCFFGMSFEQSVPVNEALRALRESNLWLEFVYFLFLTSSTLICDGLRGSWIIDRNGDILRIDCS